MVNSIVSIGSIVILLKYFNHADNLVYVLTNIHAPAPQPYQI